MDPRKDDFVTDHLNDMRKFKQRIIVLLVDSENDPKRLQRMRELIPADLENRVFVLGVLTEPEALKQKGLGSYDEIGKKMADECRTVFIPFGWMTFSGKMKTSLFDCTQLFVTGYFDLEQTSI
jgi:hypothetical protein